MEDQVCEPQKYLVQTQLPGRRGSVDQLRDQRRDTAAKLARLDALIAKLDAQPAVSDLLNEISKEL